MDAVAIPGVEWPAGMIRLMDAAGLRILLNLNGEPCANPELTIEIDAPSLLDFLHRDLTGPLYSAYVPFQNSGTCGPSEGNRAVNPIPVHYLGEPVGNIEGLISPRQANNRSHLSVRRGSCRRATRPSRPSRRSSTATGPPS